MEVIYPKAYGVDVHKSFIVAVICDSTSATPTTFANVFLPIIIFWLSLETGLLITTVIMYAWNLLVNTIFLYTMH